MRKHHQKRSKMMSEINITPFTDVVLVLLIIFMVTTPLFVQSAIKIKLPKSVSSESQTDKNIKIKISAEGAVMLNEKEVSFEALGQKLTARIINNPDLVVVIDADKQLQYDKVIRVLDISKKAGAKRLALGVEYGGQGK